MKLTDEENPYKLAPNSPMVTVRHFSFEEGFNYAIAKLQSQTPEELVEEAAKILKSKDTYAQTKWSDMSEPHKELYRSIARQILALQPDLDDTAIRDILTREKVRIGDAGQILHEDEYMGWLPDDEVERLTKSIRNLSTPSCPYPEKIIDETSEVEVDNPLYKAWMHME